MMYRIRLLALVPMVVGLLGAILVGDPLEWVREGNAAFERGEFKQAEDFYGQAEERITEPGLLAFNRGVTAYRLGNYAAAEAFYRQCLCDARERRRALALFGLANSLVRQSANRGADALVEAIRSYRGALQYPELDADQVEDILHNLELAKLLWLEARPSSPDKPQPPDQPEHNPNNSRPNRGADDRQPGSEGSVGEKPDPHGQPSPVQPGQGEKAIPTDQESAAGAGKLPPLSDKDELVPLSPEAAAAHLQLAGKRVLDAERAHLDMPTKPAGKLDR